MERPENNKWLDEALTETIGSEKPRTDFEQWKQQHPDAVKTLTSRAAKEAPASPPRLKTRRKIMTSTITKLAAAAVIAIAAVTGIYQLKDSKTVEPTEIVNEMAGPKTFILADGSKVTMEKCAKIKVDYNSETRGFEHIAGIVDVSVVKGLGEFIVATPYGDVKALGTEFTLDMVDGVTADTKEHIQLLAVEVTEGSVEVSNEKGASILKEQQKLVVEKDRAPYNISQDDNVPTRLKERMTALIDAIKASDAEAYSSNYNFNYIHKLIKGEVEYDSNLFGGSEEDSKRLQENLATIESVEALKEMFVQSLNLKGPTNVYLRDIEVSEDGQHATAKLIMGENTGRMTSTSPQWHYFDNDWWQIDD